MKSMVFEYMPTLRGQVGMMFSCLPGLIGVLEEFASLAVSYRHIELSHSALTTCSSLFPSLTFPCYGTFLRPYLFARCPEMYSGQCELERWPVKKLGIAKICGWSIGDI